MTENKRFTWEYSYYDSTGEIHDWSRKECLMTDYLQKYEIKEWCEELNKIVDENEQLKQEMGDLGTAHAEEINKIEDEFDEEILKLKKENEQLQKQSFKSRLYYKDNISVKGQYRFKKRG